MSTRAVVIGFGQFPYQTLDNTFSLENTVLQTHNAMAQMSIAYY